MYLKGIPSFNNVTDCNELQGELRLTRLPDAFHKSERISFQF